MNEIALIGFANKGMVEQAVLGHRVRTTRDFFQLPVGSEGVIAEVYKIGEHWGLMVFWDCGLKDGFGQEETKWLEVIS